MRASPRTILILVSVMALQACFEGGARSGRVTISDVTTTNVLNLASGYSGRNGDLPCDISLHIRGRINGTALIYASNWETTKLSGTIDFKIYHDWFATNCPLHYVPESVSSGELTVEYTIR